MVLVMVLASMILSAPLRWLMRRRWGLALELLLAPAFSIAMALTFSLLVFTTDELLTLPQTLAIENPEGPVSGALGLLFDWVAMGFVGVPFVALCALEKSFYVAMPMGLLHVGTLILMSRNHSHGTERPAGVSPYVVRRTSATSRSSDVE
jgi:hypothetical protein